MYRVWFPSDDQKKLLEKIQKSISLAETQRFRIGDKKLFFKSTRTPHTVHSKEQINLNYMRNNVGETPCNEIQNILQNQNITHLFAFDANNNQLVLGIENPFAIMYKLGEQNQALKPVLNKLLDSLSKDILENVKSKIKSDEQGKLLAFSDAELIDLIKQVFKQVSSLNSDNAQLCCFIDASKDVRKFILKQIQLGHPSLIANKNKAALIGGELEFIHDKWMLRNISGRYGNPVASNISAEEAIALNAKYLLLAEDILKTNGVKNISSAVFFKTGVTPPHLIALIQITNAIIAQYRDTGKIDVGSFAKSLVSIENMDKESLSKYRKVLESIPSRSHAFSIQKLSGYVL